MTGARSAHEYCVIRVVPDIERGECLNVGVVLVCRAKRFLEARIHFDRAKVEMMQIDHATDSLELIESHLAMIPRICAGDAEGGPIARLGLGERWHWLTSPSSTVIQPGPVHTGLSDNPSSELNRLFARLVRYESAGID